MKKERVAYWDNLKAVLIFLVVLGHFADFYTANSSKMQALYLFIYIFHMPCFVLVSGLFAKKAIDNRDYSQVFKYFVLYIVSKAIFSLADKFIMGKPFQFTLWSEKNPPWYMLAMAAFILMTIFLRRFNQKYVIGFFIILACFAGYDASINWDFCLSRIIVFYPFFLIGYKLNYDIFEKYKKPSLAIASVIGLVAVGLVALKFADKAIWARRLCTGQNPFEVMGDMAPYGGLLRLAYYLVAVLVGFMVLQLIPRKQFRISSIGANTLNIYMFHYPVAMFCFANKTVLKSLEHACGQWWIVGAAVVVTLFFSLGVWRRLVNVVGNVAKKVNEE